MFLSKYILYVSVCMCVYKSVTAFMWRIRGRLKGVISLLLPWRSRNWTEVVILGEQVPLLLSHLVLCLHCRATGWGSKICMVKQTEVCWSHLALFIFLFFCFYMCGMRAYMYGVCMWVGMHAQVCVWRTEMDVRCPWLTLALFTEPGSHRPCCLLICIVELASLPWGLPISVFQAQIIGRLPCLPLCEC